MIIYFAASVSKRTKPKILPSTNAAIGKCFMKKNKSMKMAPYNAKVTISAKIESNIYPPLGLPKKPIITEDY